MSFLLSDAAGSDHLSPAPFLSEIYPTAQIETGFIRVLNRICS